MFNFSFCEFRFIYWYRGNSFSIWISYYDVFRWIQECFVPVGSIDVLYIEVHDFTAPLCIHTSCISRKTYGLFRLDFIDFILIIAITIYHECRPFSCFLYSSSVLSMFFHKMWLFEKLAKSIFVTPSLHCFPKI